MAHWGWLPSHSIKSLTLSLLRVSVVCSLLLLHSIPLLYGLTIACLFVCHLQDIWAVSSLGELWIKLARAAGKYETVSWNSCTISYPCQQCRRVFSALYSCWHLYYLFLILVKGSLSLQKKSSRKHYLVHWTTTETSSNLTSFLSLDTHKAMHLEIPLILQLKYTQDLTTSPHFHNCLLDLSFCNSPATVPNRTHKPPCCSVNTPDTSYLVTPALFSHIPTWPATLLLRASAPSSSSEAYPGNAKPILWLLQAWHSFSFLHITSHLLTHCICFFLLCLLFMDCSTTLLYPY